PLRALAVRPRLPRIRFFRDSLSRSHELTVAESPTPAQTAKVVVTRLSLPGFARCDGRHRMVDCIRVASSGAAPTRRVLTMPDRSKESVSEHYRRLAQECLEMVPTIEDEDSRAISDRDGTSLDTLGQKLRRRHVNAASCNKGNSASPTTTRAGTAQER